MIVFCSVAVAVALDGRAVDVDPFRRRQDAAEYSWSDVKDAFAHDVGVDGNAHGADDVEPELCWPTQYHDVNETFYLCDEKKSNKIHFEIKILLVKEPIEIEFRFMFIKCSVLIRTQSFTG